MIWYEKDQANDQRQRGLFTSICIRFLVENYMKIRRLHTTNLLLHTMLRCNINSIIFLSESKKTFHDHRFLLKYKMNRLKTTALLQSVWRRIENIRFTNRLLVLIACSSFQLNQT